MMAKVSEIVLGLQIIERYCNPNVCLGGADHDIIYAPPI